MERGNIPVPLTSSAESCNWAEATSSPFFYPTVVFLWGCLARRECNTNRSKENKLSDRPNAFIVIVGKKGYTSVRQSNYWAVDTVNSCKDYSDQELAQILNTITKDLGALRFFGYQDAKLVNYKGEEVED